MIPSTETAQPAGEEVEGGQRAPTNSNVSRLRVRYNTEPSFPSSLLKLLRSWIQVWMEMFRVLVPSRGLETILLLSLSPVPR